MAGANSQRRIAALLCFSVGGILSAGCAQGSNAVGTSQRTTERITSVSIPASTVTVGFKYGQIRKDFELASFKISKYPVTFSEYGACVSAGACKAIDDACSEKLKNTDGSSTPQGISLEGPEQAELCAGSEGAKSYCEWQGGSLPSLAQWSLAARGPKIQRFAWGENQPSCDQHPGGLDLASDIHKTLRARRVEGTPCSADYRIGHHTAGASPFGIEDVLLAPGELVRTEKGSPFSACVTDNPDCVIQGFRSGAIDTVRPTRRTQSVKNAKAGSESQNGSSVVDLFGFRCVWEEEG